MKNTMSFMCAIGAAIATAGIVHYKHKRSPRVLRSLDVYISPDTLAAEFPGNYLAESIVSLVCNRLSLNTSEQEILRIETVDTNMLFIVMAGQGYRHEIMYGTDTSYLCCDQFRYKK